MRSAWIRWVTGAGIGICVVIGAYLIAYPRYYSPKAVLARHLGADPAAYLDATALVEKAGKTKHLTDGEVESLGALADDRSRAVRVNAVGALMYLGGTGQARAAARIAARKVNDPEREVRLVALKTLYRLDAPEAADAARKLSNDPDETVRSRALQVAGRHSGGK